MLFILREWEAGDVYIKEYGAEPTVTWVSPDETYISTYFMSDFTEEMGLTSDVHKRIPVFSLQYCIDLWEQVMGDMDKATFEEMKARDAAEAEGEAEAPAEGTAEGESEAGTQSGADAQ